MIGAGKQIDFTRETLPDFAPMWKGKLVRVGNDVYMGGDDGWIYLGGIVTSSLIGIPDDGDYLDGLFTSWSNVTKVSNAMDDINRILLALAPEMGYIISSAIDLELSNATITSGTVYLAGSASGGNLGWDNVSYKTGDSNGQVVSETVITNTDPVMTLPLVNDYGFADADKGELMLYWQDEYVFTEDETEFIYLGDSFDESLRDTEQVITREEYNKGAFEGIFVKITNDFPLWQQGLFAVDIGNDTNIIVDGYNKYNLVHRVDGLARTSNSTELRVSDVTTPTVTTCSFGSVPNNLPNGGYTTKTLSGIEYIDSGIYNTISSLINGFYGIVYPNKIARLDSSPTGIFVPRSVNTSSVSHNPSFVSGSVNPNTIAFSNESLEIATNATVLLGETVDVTSRPYNNKNNLCSSPVHSGTPLTNILIDAQNESSTDTKITFNDESRRYTIDETTDLEGSGSKFNSTSISPDWNSSYSLTDTAAIAGYDNALQQYGGKLVYPTENFTTIVAPSAGYDYTDCSGIRYAVYEFNTSGQYTAFSLEIKGISVSDIGTWGEESSKIVMKLALPTQTTDGIDDPVSGNPTGNFEFKDCMQAFTGEKNKGCYEGDPPSSGVDPVLLLNTGSRHTNASGGKVIIVISYPDDYIGEITELNMTFR